ncbi:MAG: hypothetical protein HYZ75_04110 [Elusimicrobia bacterium]|nr:hypothetical protein [Elusimicrobiota bacterium]
MKAALLAALCMSALGSLASAEILDSLGGDALWLRQGQALMQTLREQRESVESRRKDSREGVAASTVPLRVTLINNYREFVGVRLYGVWNWVEPSSARIWLQPAEGRMNFWIVAPTRNPSYALTRDPDGIAHLALTFGKPDWAGIAGP